MDDPLVLVQLVFQPKPEDSSLSFWDLNIFHSPHIGLSQIRPSSFLRYMFVAFQRDTFWMQSHQLCQHGLDQLSVSISSRTCSLLIVTKCQVQLLQQHHKYFNAIVMFGFWPCKDWMEMVPSNILYFTLPINFKQHAANFNMLFCKHQHVILYTSKRYSGNITLIWKLQAWFRQL